jgi:hypothetical protein
MSEHGKPKSHSGLHLLVHLGIEKISVQWQIGALNPSTGRSAHASTHTESIACNDRHMLSSQLGGALRFDCLGYWLRHS